MNELESTRSLASSGTAAPAFMVIIMPDDSMERRGIYAGDECYIDPQRELEPGCIAAIKGPDGKPTLRKVWYYDGGMGTITERQDYKADQMKCYSAEQLEKLIIYGRLASAKHTTDFSAAVEAKAE